MQILWWEIKFSSQVRIVSIAMAIYEGIGRAGELLGTDGNVPEICGKEKGGIGHFVKETLKKKQTNKSCEETQDVW